MADGSARCAGQELQWGRGGEAAESPAIDLETIARVMLQWGRGGEAAERRL